MRILFLTPRLPFPPYRGDRLRSYNFLRVLGQEHEITLVSFIQDPAEREHIPELAPYCTTVNVVPLSAQRSALSVAANAWRRQPLQALYYHSAAMHQLLDGLFARGSFDLAYAQLFRMAPYLERRRELYRIIDFTDLISLEVEASLAYRSTLWRAVYSMEHPRQVAYEHRVAAWADEIWFINERDRVAFARVDHHAALQVIPNALDLYSYRALNPNPVYDLLFTGNLDVPHNRDALQFLITEIMPRVWVDLPEATLNIAGAGGQEVIRAMCSDPRIHVSGFLPRLEEAYAQSRVFVAPLRFAAGTQNKVLEAMAAGLPVVTTKVVYEGLDAGGAAVALLAEDASSFVRQLVMLLGDANQRRELGITGKDFVAQRYANPVVEAHMRDLSLRLTG